LFVVENHADSSSVPGNVLNALAAVASNNVWAVGFSFDCISLLKPMALHWDGTKWNVVSTPKLNTNDNTALNGIVALASNNIYAVGYSVVLTSVGTFSRSACPRVASRMAARFSWRTRSRRN
jgi:hypothetical protein